MSEAGGRPSCSSCTTLAVQQGVAVAPRSSSTRTRRCRRPSHPARRLTASCGLWTGRCAWDIGQAWRWRATRGVCALMQVCSLRRRRPASPRLAMIRFRSSTVCDTLPAHARGGICCPLIAMATPAPHAPLGYFGCYGASMTSCTCALHASACPWSCALPGPAALGQAHCFLSCRTGYRPQPVGAPTHCDCSKYLLSNSLCPPRGRLVVHPMRVPVRLQVEHAAQRRRSRADCQAAGLPQCHGACDAHSGDRRPRHVAETHDCRRRICHRRRPVGLGTDAPCAAAAV